MFRSGLAQRIVVAFIVLTSVVAGSFAVGIVITIHAMEERLLSDDLGGDLEALLKMDTIDEWRNKPQSNQLFYFTDGPAEFALPEDLTDLTEGFHEIHREDGSSYYVMVGIVEGRHYVLLQDQTDFERREQFVYAIVTVGFLISLFSAGLLGWLLARRVLAPVIQLAHQVRHRDQQLTLAPPLAPDYAPDEVGQLAAAFDETLMQLRDALKRERLFTSDVSHELRTPLMVLASSCELLEENPNLDVRSQRQVQRMRRAIRDMQDLVETFLQLARIESGQISAPTATLTAVADELVAHWRDPIEAKGLVLEYLTCEDTERRYNAPFLRAVLGNLLRNAWHYSEGGCIRLTLTERGFTVEDDGAGIPDTLRETLFEPFVRGEPNRGDGLGLGLSLVKRICKHEHWVIQLWPVEPHGCRFEVTLRPRPID